MVMMMILGPYSSNEPRKKDFAKGEEKGFEAVFFFFFLLFSQPLFRQGLLQFP